MQKQSFFNREKAVLTLMIQAETPERIKQLMDLSAPGGAEAFGIQFEQLLPQYRTPEIFRELFAYAKEKPLYVTNYRTGKNGNQTDEQLVEGILQLADCGADLCDIMGDLYDKQPDELAVDQNAIQKQMELIETLHQKGAKVLMSSHVYRYTAPERVLEMALEQERRGADICKIVTGASNMEEQLENLKTVNLLKNNLKTPFLFLAVGQSGLLRRLGGELGCCMYLCVQEYDALATPAQPLLQDVYKLRELIKL